MKMVENQQILAQMNRMWLGWISKCSQGEHSPTIWVMEYKFRMVLKIEIVVAAGSEILILLEKT